MATWDNNRGGRPRKQDGKTESVRVRVTRDELAVIERQASIAGQTVSAFVRAALLDVRPKAPAIDRHDLSRIIVALKAIQDPRIPPIIDRVREILSR